MRTNKPNVLISYSETIDIRKVVEEKQPLDEYYAKSDRGNCPNWKNNLLQEMELIAQMAPKLLALTKQFEVSFSLLGTMEHSWCFSGRNSIKGQPDRKVRGKRNGVCLYWKFCFWNMWNNMTGCSSGLSYLFSSRLYWQRGYLVPTDGLLRYSLSTWPSWSHWYLQTASVLLFFPKIHGRAHT